MKRRTILLIALAVMIVLLGVLLYVPRKKNLDAQKEKEEIIAGEKNVAEVFNQAENILSYNGYTFIVDSEKNAIIRYSEKENQGKQIIYATNETIGNQLFVMGNKLIFNVGKNTYYSDLDGNNSSKITDGNIVYMDNDVYVYILQDKDSQYVCITSYNNKNLTRTTDTFFNIAKGNDIRYLKEYDKVLFFYSYNTNKTTTLFSVDLNKSESTVLINSPTAINDSKYKYVDIAKIGDIAYLLEVSYQVSTNIETYADNALYYVSMDAIVSELYAQNIKPLRIFANDKKLYFKQYNSDTNQYEWTYRGYDKDNKYVVSDAGILDKDSKEYWSNTLYGDLTELFTLESGELKMDGVLFTTLDGYYKNATLRYAGLFTNEVYILVNQSGKNIWFRFDNDGSNPKKIYEYNK